MIRLATLVLVMTSAGRALASGPQLVDVGLYVNQVTSVSLPTNRFSIDAYVWFRWTGADLNPLETFEIVDGQVDSKTKIQETTLADGKKYATCRVTATLARHFNAAPFPFDDHVLVIALEDGANEESKVRFLPDSGNSGVDPGLQAPGWSVGKPIIDTVSHEYSTNYGDTSLRSAKDSTYSRFQFAIPLNRVGIGYFVKLFCGLFVAVALAFLAFFVRPTDEPRFGLGVGAIFAAVASEYVVSACLPPTHVVTLADALHVLAFVFIFLSIAESVWSLRVFRDGTPQAKAKSKRLDAIAASAWLIAFVGLCAFAIHRY